MFKSNLSHGKHKRIGRTDNSLSFILLILSFLAGCLAGSLIGSLFEFDSALNDFAGISALETTGAVSVFFRFIRFHLVAFLLGSSYFGIVLLPVLSCIRGYALSCTAATIISCYPQNGIIMAILILGIPAIISLPCFFTISIDGFSASARLFHLVRGNSAPAKDKLYARTLFCLPFLIGGSLIEFKLVPYMVSLLT